MIIALLLLADVALIALLIAYFSRKYRAPDLSRFDTPYTTPMMDDEAVSDAHNAVVQRLNDYHKLPKTTNMKVNRQRMEDIFYREVDAEIRQADVNGVPGEWVLTPGADPGLRLLYLHGGAFAVGSPKTHRYITSELSRRAGVAVLAIDYRMIPEHKVINCHEDARIGYEWILQNGPDGPSPARRLFVAGDSAGGNLTLAVIAWARDNRLTAANGAVAFAPLTDATLSSPTWHTNKDTDPFLAPGVGRMFKIPWFIRAIYGRWTNGKPLNHPEISPLLGHLGSLPPTLVQVSREEMLYGDAQRYANKAAAEGGDVTLQVWPRLVHVFQGFPELPECDDALNLAADFIKQHARTGEERQLEAPAA